MGDGFDSVRWRGRGGTYHLLATDAGQKKKDRENIQGTWRFVSIKDNGSNIDQKEFETVEIVIAADRIKVGFPDKARESTYRIDPAAKPKTIDMVPEEGGGKAVELGIYKLEGDTLTLCYNGGKERPKAFESKEGSGTKLVVLKRVKK